MPSGMLRFMCRLDVYMNYGTFKERITDTGNIGSLLAFHCCSRAGVNAVHCFHFSTSPLGSRFDPESSS